MSIEDDLTHAQIIIVGLLNMAQELVATITFNAWKPHWASKAYQQFYRNNHPNGPPTRKA